jgi:hypothetical protein
VVLPSQALYLGAKKSKRVLKVEHMANRLYNYKAYFISFDIIITITVDLHSCKVVQEKWS